MGCGASKSPPAKPGSSKGHASTPPPTVRSSHDRASSTTTAQQRASTASSVGYSAFLSHYKVEAATEARWLQGELEAIQDGLAFLDSDDLRDLSQLQDFVRQSGCVLLVLHFDDRLAEAVPEIDTLHASKG